MIIGPTGTGKSVLANRLSGNVGQDVYNLSELSENKDDTSIDFLVSEFGNTNPTTQGLKHVTNHVWIFPQSDDNELEVKNNINDSCNEEKTTQLVVKISKQTCAYFNLSVVDTRGAFDPGDSNNRNNNNNNNNSNNNNQFAKPHELEHAESKIDTAQSWNTTDEYTHYINELVEFVKKLGGVDMFCITFKFGSKLDANYQQLLQLYQQFWGKKFWKHCVIIVTHCDKNMQKITNAKLDKTKAQIRSFLKEKCQVDPDSIESIPVLPIGDDNFAQTIADVMVSLDDTNSSYQLFRPESMTSLLDKTCEKLQQLRKEYKTKVQELNPLLNKLQQFKHDDEQSATVLLFDRRVHQM